MPEHSNSGFCFVMGDALDASPQGYHVCSFDSGPVPIYCAWEEYSGKCCKTNMLNDEYRWFLTTCCAVVVHYRSLARQQQHCCCSQLKLPQRREVVARRLLLPHSNRRQLVSGCRWRKPATGLQCCISGLPEPAALLGAQQQLHMNPAGQLAGVPKQQLCDS